MRKVTCRITGESGYSHEFYKAPIRKNLQEDGLLNVEDDNETNNAFSPTTLPSNLIHEDLIQKVDVENFEEIDLGNIENVLSIPIGCLKKM